MRKKIVGALAILLTTVLVTMMLSACSSNPIVGTWKRVEGEDGFYPGILILKEDGTGSADGISINWATTSDVITFGFWGRQNEHGYTVHGSSLLLKEITDGDNTNAHEATFKRQ